MGSTDRIIRISAAVLIAILYFTNTISGTLALVLGAFAIIFILTSFISVCPLYMPFGLSTRKKNIE
ncbi:DUF2892 domain-containing protein [Flavobacterium sp. LS2P90]|uniref:DUF2892 domain-containing protein n=1 Tax=Flavobacterium xylosi TaxID=3230415 RepID=A0ABW6HYJ1_9FLAO